MQSRSLAPLLEGRSGYRHREAVRHDNYKMVYYPGKPHGELYDLAEDPAESGFCGSSREYEMVDGHTAELQRQSWYLNDLLPLYSTWEFRENGKVR